MNITEGGAPELQIGAGHLYEEALYHAYQALPWHHSTDRTRHHLIVLGLTTLAVFA